MKKIIRSFFTLYFLVSLVVFYSQNTGASFANSGNATNNDFSAICWANPGTTSLTSLIDDTNTNATNITFDWAVTTSSCPIATLTYNFQIYSDVGLSTLVVQSGFLGNLTYPFNSIPEGEYWWRVQAKDQYGNQSNSTTYHLVVDRTEPLETSLSIAGSYTKAVEEKLANGDFSSGDLTGWTSVGSVQVLSSDLINDPSSVITPVSSIRMVRIGDTEDMGNMVWENRLMQSFATGAKSLSVHYNFFSRESAGFDEPGFFIRLNGQEIFRKNNLDSDGTTAINTGWSDYYYDLSNLTGSLTNLSLYAGNTGDNFGQSWVYIDKISTYFVTAPEHATYSLSGFDNPGGSGIDHYEYRIDNGSTTLYSVPFGGLGSTLAVNGSHTIQYYSVDKAGNNGPIKTVSIMTDVTAPSTISDLLVSSTDINTATLTWSAPGNDGSSGKAASYDVRYSAANITNDDEFNFATKVEKVPAPQEAGTSETLEILGLNPLTTYYFAIKISDEAPNTSALSNVAFGTTLPGSDVNNGDIVINELMWMGSAASDADEWLELRNMANHSIDLSNFKLTKFDGTTETDMAISFTDKSIRPNGYFLIVNGNSYVSGDSHLKNTITPDIWNSSLDLSNTTLMINLYWNDGTTDNVIDIAWNGTSPQEGVYETTLGSEKYYSMERTSVPGDGINTLNWYTCIDSASTGDFFDGTADERGTPGYVNRSENEPYNSAPASTTATPEASLILSDDKKTVSFFVNNILGYEKLSYELRYDAFTSAKGLLGSDVDISSTDKFEKNSLDLATCSGEICTYDQDVKNFKLIITLTAKDGKETKLEKSL